MNGNPDYSCWLSLEQAAQRLGSTPLNVLLHVKRGLLAGAAPEGVWLVEPASLAALLEKRREGAVPAVCSSGCGKKTHGCDSCP